MHTLEPLDFIHLENDVVVMHNKTLHKLIAYINTQTTVINELRKDLSETKEQLTKTLIDVSNNTDNIKKIAKALEGVYKHEM